MVSCGNSLFRTRDSCPMFGNNIYIISSKIYTTCLDKYYWPTFLNIIISLQEHNVTRYAFIINLNVNVYLEYKKFNKHLTLQKIISYKLRLVLLKPLQFYLFYWTSQRFLIFVMHNKRYY